MYSVTGHEEFIYKGICYSNEFRCDFAENWLKKMPSSRGRRQRLLGEWSSGKGGRQGGSKQAHCGCWRGNNIIDNYNNPNIVRVSSWLKFRTTWYQLAVGQHRHFNTFR